MKKGLFITFEGIDGCGKTTQLNKAKEFLEQKGFNVATTKEPGHGETGAEIRNLVLHHKGIISDGCEMFLFLADRAQHIETFIKPSIKEGKVVLCDRHIDSTVAYQGFGRGHNIETLKELNKIATGNLLPDLTLLYDVPVEISMQRVGKERDRMESAGNDFQAAVREGFLKLAEKYPERIKIIDATAAIENVFEQTKKHIESKINEEEA